MIAACEMRTRSVTAEGGAGAGALALREGRRRSGGGLKRDRSSDPSDCVPPRSLPRTWSRASSISDVSPASPLPPPPPSQSPPAPEGGPLVFTLPQEMLEHVLSFLPWRAVPDFAAASRGAATLVQQHLTSLELTLRLPANARGQRTHAALFRWISRAHPKVPLKVILEWLDHRHSHICWAAVQALSLQPGGHYGATVVLLPGPMKRLRQLAASELAPLRHAAATLLQRIADSRAEREAAHLPSREG